MTEVAEPVYLNHRLWELYREDCRQKVVSPSIKDFILWCEEEGYGLEGA